MIPLINEQYYDKLTFSSNDTLIRFVKNKSFSSIFVLSFEKVDSLCTLSIKEIPKVYYNPFYRYNSVILKYSFLKKTLSNEDWSDIVKLAQLNSIINDKNYDQPAVDGEYVYFEFMTEEQYLKNIFQEPFSVQQKYLIEFLDSIIIKTQR